MKFYIIETQITVKKEQWNNIKWLIDEQLQCSNLVEIALRE